MFKSSLTKLSAVLFSYLMILFFASCQDVEVTNVKELAYRHNYENNFVKLYGEISPDQTWDFSSYAKEKMRRNQTRAGNATADDFGIDLYTDGGKQWFNVPTDVHDWVFENVMEENGMANNKERIKDELWHAFSFEATMSDAYDLLPFYLGASQSLYTFNIVVVDPDTDQTLSTTTLWDLEKDTHMQWQSNGGSGWHPITGSSGSGGHGSTMQARTTRAEPILVDFSDPKYGLTDPDKKYVVYYQIYVKKGHPQINEAGDELTSITHLPNMVAIEMPEDIAALTNDEGHKAMLIGCETGSLDHIDRSDYDFNDLMFLMVGRIPDIYYDEEEMIVMIKKRYMIEDLTGYDYDFNDIVADVKDSTVHYFIINEEYGEKEEHIGLLEANGKTYPIIKQEATIKWLCGTLPFQLKIGDFTFGQVTDPTNLTDTKTQLARTADVYGGTVTTIPATPGIAPELKVEISGWNPDTNNVTAWIWIAGTDPVTPPNPSGSASYSHEGLWTGAEGIWVSTFPDAGDVPYIICTDQTVDWMGEQTHIPTTWLGGDMSTDDATSTTIIPVNNTTNP